MKTVVKTEGFAELDKALGDLTKATARNVLRRTLVIAGEPIAAKARALAPDDPDGPAKDLKGSIKVSPKIKNTTGNAEYSAVLRSGGSKQEAGSAMRTARRQAKKQESFAEMHVGPERGRNSKIGALQEFGTAHHSPQPFMRPAWDAHKEEVLDIVGQVLGDEIAKAVARAAKKKLKGR